MPIVIPVLSVVSGAVLAVAVCGRLDRVVSE
jgi:hypothetical protein